MDLLAAAYDEDEADAEDLQPQPSNSQVSSSETAYGHESEPAVKKVKTVDRSQWLKDGLHRFLSTSPLLPSKALADERNAVWHWLRGLILKEFQSEFAQAACPDSCIRVFGSWVCNMWVASSDIDVNLFTEFRIPRAFHRLKAVVLEEEPQALIDIVAGARVPLIKIRARGLSFDITHEHGKDNPVVEHHDAVRAWAQRWAEDESICIAIRIIKLWAERNKVGSATTGTLNSMGYLIMLLAAMGETQCVARELHDEEAGAAQADAGPWLRALGHLERFFRAYSDPAAWRRVIYAPDSAVKTEGAELDRLRLSREVRGDDGTGRGTTLFIQDPFLPEVNLGRFVDKHSVKKIRAAMERAARTLSTSDHERHDAFAVWQQMLAC